MEPNEDLWSISFDQLEELEHEARTRFGHDFPTITMRDMMEIVTEDCPPGTSYASWRNNAVQLPLQVFVTHSWDGRFQEFVESIRQAFRFFPIKPNLWICSFCLPQDQHALYGLLNNRPLEELPFTRAINAAEWFVVVRNSKTDLYGRIWCVCELTYALEYNKLGRTLVTGPSTWANVRTSCENAKASFKADVKRIRQELIRLHGSFEEVDRLVQIFREHPSAVEPSFMQRLWDLHRPLLWCCKAEPEILQEENQEDEGAEIDEVDQEDEENPNMVPSEIQQNRFLLKTKADPIRHRYCWSARFLVLTRAILFFEMMYLSAAIIYVYRIMNDIKEGKIGTDPPVVVRRTDIIPDIFHGANTTFPKKSPQSRALAWVQNHPQFTKMTGTRMSQLFALATLPFSTKGPSKPDCLWHPSRLCSEWLDYNKAECEWEGITCDAESFVQKIDFENRNLQGQIPKEISRLRNLTDLILRVNYLKGSLPSELGLLTKLTNLDMDANPFMKGPLPTELGKLLSLRRLLLRALGARGRIPSELGLLTNLTYLALDQNQFSSSIPTQLGRLTNLEQLFLQNAEGKHLFGTLPTELGLMTNLMSISLGFNQFKGVIPTEIGLLTNLASVWLDSNPLTGQLPTELVKLLKLNVLWVNSTNVTGPLPLGLNITDLRLPKN